MSQDEDQSLISRVAKGDREAFRELFSAYQPRLYSYLMKLLGNKAEAEDVLVDTMFTVWKDAKRFKSASKLSTWIFGIAHNKALNAMRSRGRRAESQLESAEPACDPTPSPHNQAATGLLRVKIQAALGKLSREHREVVELTFYEGFSYEEIARIVSCPVNTVKTRMFHARKKLKQLLSEMGLAGGY
jgi:RNA polymerase sigma-70 factor (ECF subfamily)